MKLSLDYYISFVESDNKSDFAVDFINQILHSHGFKKIYKTPKKLLVEAVESIKLMNPSSITLRQNISSAPAISHDEANSDVKSLDWFECPNCRVTSVQSHNIHNEALTSTELVVYEETEKDELMQSNWKSTGKRPARHSSPSPVKTKKRANRRRRSDDQFVDFP